MIFKISNITKTTKTKTDQTHSSGTVDAVFRRSAELEPLHHTSGGNSPSPTPNPKRLLCWAGFRGRRRSAVQRTQTQQAERGWTIQGLKKTLLCHHEELCYELRTQPGLTSDGGGRKTMKREKKSWEEFAEL